MGRFVNNPYPPLGVVDGIIPISRGGTGAATADEAVTNLGGIKRSSIGLPGGPIKLTPEGTLPANVVASGTTGGVTISGPTWLYVNAAGTYNITNFDSNTNYAITPIRGTASRSGSVITYNSPADEGVAGFAINGKIYNIDVTSNRPLAPSVLSPTEGSSSSGSSITATSSAFLMPQGSDTHTSSDWELSLTPNFVNPYVAIYDSATSKLSVQFDNLSVNTLYYMRVRYHSATFGVGNWSPIRSFRTKTLFETLLVKGHLTISGSVGSLSAQSIDISPDGLNMSVAVSPTVFKTYDYSALTHMFAFSHAVGPAVLNEEGLRENFPKQMMFHNGGKVLSMDNGVGKFLISDSTITSEINFRSAYLATYPGDTDIRVVDFGLSDNGKVLAYVITSTRSGAYKAELWLTRRDLTTGAFPLPAPIAVLTDRETAANMFVNLEISATGKYITVADVRKTKVVGGINQYGEIYSYVYDNISYIALDPVLYDNTYDSRFGHSIAIDETYGMMIVGAPKARKRDGTDITGRIFIYKYTSGSWLLFTQESFLPSAIGANIGHRVKISNDGLRLYVASPEINTVAKLGNVYMLKYNTTLQNWKYYGVLPSSTEDQRVLYGTDISINSDGTCLAVSEAPIGALAGTGIVTILS